MTNIFINPSVPASHYLCRRSYIWITPSSVKQCIRRRKTIGWGRVEGGEEFAHREPPRYGKKGKRRKNAGNGRGRRMKKESAKNRLSNRFQDLIGTEALSIQYDTFLLLLLPRLFSFTTFPSTTFYVSTEGIIHRQEHSFEWHERVGIYTMYTRGGNCGL